jgi:GMP synthase (glutamine-hydrolysing)
MTVKNKSLKILVINNAEKGITQFTQPILDILDEARVSSVTAEYKEIPDVKDFHGIIMGGSPRGDDIVDHHQPWFQWIKTCDIPIFGFCAGHHITGKMYGAELLRSVEVEVGDFYITIDRPDDPLFKGCQRDVLVRQDHHDSITLPPGFILLAHSEICKVEAMKHPTKPIYTTQFHPEILNKDMMLNFLDIIKTAAKAPLGHP